MSSIAIAIVTSASIAEVTSANARHVTSAETAHVTSASAATPVSSASAGASCLCSTRRKQRPGKKGGCQYLHRSSSH
jgi:hypothetical protein